MVPMGEHQWQFFLGNTRRSRYYKLRPELAAALMQLDSQFTLAEVAHRSGANPEGFEALARALHASCILEDDTFLLEAASSPWRRVLNFIADYIPSDGVKDAFARLAGTEVIILGVGAVGSWVATQLCQSGVRHLVLIDNDKVDASNLNRSLYTLPDVGRYKVDALAQRLQSINPHLTVCSLRQVITDSSDLARMLQDPKPPSIVVNCADSPSVDVTSALIDAACQPTRTAYVIAGGYNLHLSLIGMTVLPKQTACYHCGRLTLEYLQGDDLVGLRKLARPWRNIGNLAPLAAITASFAANEVIRVALSDSRIPPAMINRRGEFNFLTSEMHFTSLPPREECGCIPCPEVSDF